MPFSLVDGQSIVFGLSLIARWSSGRLVRICQLPLITGGRKRSLGSYIWVVVKFLGGSRLLLVSPTCWISLHINVISEHPDRGPQIRLGSLRRKSAAGESGDSAVRDLRMQGVVNTVSSGAWWDVSFGPPGGPRVFQKVWLTGSYGAGNGSSGTWIWRQAAGHGFTRSGFWK